MHISDEILRGIRRKHKIDFEGCLPVKSVGIINDVYKLGDRYVLRVPKYFGGPTDQAFREQKAIPAARAAGVRTPNLVAFDADCDILEIPYLIVEFVDAPNFESRNRDPASTPEVWRELGRDLAKLHAGTVVLEPPTWADIHLLSDPRPKIDECFRLRWLSPIEAARLHAWVDRLAPLVAGSIVRGPRFVHADVQMSNVLVAGGTCDYLALIDWGCALMCDDVTVDFLATPMSAVPLMLEGHREIAKLDMDETAEARIVWRRIVSILSDICSNPQTNYSWYNRPIARMVDLLLFFASQQNSRWRQLAPP
jgi:aminoglycoside phosphotransferase (APT) family kinase protein